MKEALNKISSYNILNYLIPGAVFWYLCQELCGITLPSNDIVENLFIFYFVGMMISCIGSVVVEPILRKIKFITFAKYDNFLKAVEHDTKINTLSEINNAYRTMIALSLVLAITKIYVNLSTKFERLSLGTGWIIIIVIFILFTLSYAKQTIYISKRVSKVIAIQNRGDHS